MLKFKSKRKRQLIKAQETTAKINSLLEKSSQIMACGPICQKQKTSNDLKQKYLNAQTNLITAPIQLNDAKRKYYVYTEGEAYYNNLNETELKNQVSQIASKLKEYLDENVYIAHTMNNLYETTLLNSENGDILLKDYDEKNNDLDNTITDMYGAILTNDRKTFYENEANEKLLSWYNLLWIIYYLLVLGFLIAIFLTQSKYSFLGKSVIFILILFYPYYIHHIIKFLYYIYTNIKNIFPKNVYNNL